MLKRIPTPNDLSRMYYELASLGAPASGEKKPWPYRIASLEELLALASDMVRYDPRLLSILIIFLKNSWNKLNPLKLRHELKRCRESKRPQVMGVIGEFVKSENRDIEVKYFFDYLTKGVEPVAWQLFFLGTYPPGSSYFEKIGRKRLKEYRKWGFLSMERPVVDLRTKRQAGSLSREARLRILEMIIRKKGWKKGRITLKEYLQAVDHSISRQQALSDIKSVKTLEPLGHGRNAQWKLK
jgi:hypothetical protein